MIYKTVTDSYEFANWVANSDTYKNNFSWRGAQALQEYLEELSNDLGENIEFDPVAWCCGYSEYKNFNEFQHDTGGSLSVGYPNIEDLEKLRDYTAVIEFDGGLIIQDF